MGCSDSSSLVPDGSVAFAASTPVGCSFVPVGSHPAPRGPGPCLRRADAVLLRGNEEVSQVPGEPRCAHAPLSDPGGVPCARPTCGTEMLPSVIRMTLASTMFSLTRFHHAACALPVYASPPRSLAVDATLGSGWGPAFAGRGWLPAGFHYEVSATSPPPRPGFSWRTLNC